jgi:hypothetical protein
MTMKKMIVSVAMMSILAMGVGCVKNPTVQTNVVYCRSDSDCDQSLGYYCGFATINSYAICRH